jgi:HAMP domain-containing protein/HPt (histidine-containing phosphotransfer) domain-containing protein
MAPLAARRGLNIAQQLSLLIVSVLVSIVAGLIAYLGYVQSHQLREQLASKAKTYSQLAATQVRSAVAFDDKETAREVFESLQNDTDLIAVALYVRGGTLLQVRGTPGAVGQNAKGGVEELKVFDLNDRYLAVTPVVSPEGPRGVLTLELSKAGLVQSVDQVQRAAVLAGGVALIIGLLLAVTIARSFAQRLEAIADVAEAVAGGDLNQEPTQDRRADEIGSLVRSFTVMLRQIKSLMSAMQIRGEQEQQRLQGLVARRTAELETRNREMRLIMDNAGQGFVTIDAEGTMSLERSAVLARWFGRAGEGASLWHYLNKVDPTLALSIEVGWEEVQAGLLPLEVTLDQMPKRFVVADSHYALQFKPILDHSGAPAQTVVVISDVTAEVHAERAAEHEKELLQLLGRARSDRAGVMDFLREAGQIVEDVTRGPALDLVLTKRLLHTLKGNAGIMGLGFLARLCHDLETTVADVGTTLSDVDRDRLRSWWLSFDNKVRSTLGPDQRDNFVLSKKEFEGLVALLRARSSHDAIAAHLEQLQLEPTELRLSRLGSQVEGLAEQLGKTPIEVRIEHNDIRMPHDGWSDVWVALPHLVRNAIDHGLETPEERAKAGKPVVGVLSLRTQRRDGRFSIEIQDFGRGVNWERLRESAKKAGLPSATHEDLVNAMFADGVSTKTEISEISGRGVGMAAVRASVEARGGRIEIISERGRGTCMKLVWPEAVLAS